MKKWVCLVLMSGWGVGLRGQEQHDATARALTSDRPGFSDGVNVLPAGLLQLESGFSFSGQSSGTSVDRTFIGGSPLLRMGVGHGAELRFGGDGFRSYSHRAGAERERALRIFRWA
jgi:hypothetical protein